MASGILQTLRIVFRAESAPAVRGIQQVEREIKRLEATAPAIDKVANSATRLFSQRASTDVYDVQAAKMVAVSRAADLYRSTISALDERIGTLRSSLYAAVVPIAATAGTMGEAVSRADEFVVTTRAIGDSLSIASPRAVTFGTAVSVFNQQLSAAIPRVGALTGALSALNILNFNPFRNLDDVNINAALRGAGRLGNAFIALNSIIRGSSTPFAILQRIVGLTTPLLVVMAESLSKSVSPAAQIAAVRLKTLAAETSIWGKSITPRPFNLFAGAIVRGAQSIGGATAKAIAYLSGFGPAMRGLFDGSARARMSFQSLTSQILSATTALSAFIGRTTGKAVNEALNIALYQTGRLLTVVSNAAWNATKSLLAIPFNGLRNAATGAASSIMAIPRSLVQTAISAARATANVLTLGRAFRQSATDAQAAAAGANMASASFGRGAKAMQGLTFGLSQIGPMVGVLATLGVVAGGVFAAIGAAVQAVSSAVEFEQINIAFETIIGNAEQAKATLASLEQFANVTPFDTPEVIRAGQALLALGFAADQLVPTMEYVGNISAGLKIPFEELATLMGQFRAQVKIQTQDLKQLSTRGIPIIRELAKTYGVTEQEVFRLAESGQLSFKNIEYAMKSLSAEGGQFEGLMDKQSQSVAGLFSTLMSEVLISLRNIGTGLLEAWNVKGGLRGLIAGVQFIRETIVPAYTEWVTPIIKTIRESLGTVFSWLYGVVVDNVGPATQFFGAAWSAAAEAFGMALGWIQSTAQSVFGWVNQFVQSTFGSSITTIFNEFASLVSAAFYTAEYAILHWRDVGYAAAVNVSLAFVRFGAQVQYALTVAIPEALGYFARNWRTIFVDLLNGTFSVFVNLKDNIVSIMREIWDYIASAGTDSIDFAWKPLLDGFKATTTEILRIAPRQIGELEQQLANEAGRVNEALGKGLAEHIAARQKELEEQKKARAALVEPPAPPKPPAPLGAPPPLEEIEKKKKSAAKRESALTSLEVGSSEDIKRVAQAQAGRTESFQRGSLKRQDRTIQELRAIRDVLTDQFVLPGAI